MRHLLLCSSLLIISCATTADFEPSSFRQDDPAADLEVASLDGLGSDYIVDATTPLADGTEAIALTITDGDFRKNGTYQRIYSDGTIGEGTFSALPENAAIGFASLVLTETSPVEKLDWFMISSIGRDEDGAIDVLEVNAALMGAPTAPLTPVLLRLSDVPLFGDVSLK